MRGQRLTQGADPFVERRDQCAVGKAGMTNRAKKKRLIHLTKLEDGVGGAPLIDVSITLYGCIDVELMRYFLRG